MLIVVEGDLGTGKTLLLSHYGEKETEVPVYPNYNLKVPMFEKKITPFEIESLNRGLVLLQGFYTWLDCRLSSSELNRYLTRDLVFNARKRELTVMVDYQIEDSIDKRFMKLVRLHIEAHGLSSDDSGFIYTYNYMKRGKVLASKEKMLPFERAKKLFNLYNTYEPEQTHTPSVFEPNRLNKYVNAVIKFLQKYYDGKLSELTKVAINDILIEHKKSVPSRKVLDLIYSRIKRNKL